MEFKRDIYNIIEKRIENRFILALTGLRRVGKTTILYQLIQNLIEKKVEPTNILFFSFDDNKAEISDIINSYKDFQKKDFRKERVYIFFDEIQKCVNWENEIKKYYDLYPKIKFIISGSESLFIKKRMKETLAGRLFDFVLATFTFNEYLKFNGVNESEFKYETKIKPFLHSFIERGGFPESLSFKNDREFREYIKALVVDKIVYQDIPKLFKIQDPEFLKVLLELIATNPGAYIDYQSLSKQFDKDRRIIKNYISYLKEGFLINMLGNYRKGSIATLRKKKRAYPTDNSLIYLYTSNINSDFFGKMVETCIVNCLNATTFWKDNGEIDIIHKGIPIEVKYQEKINFGDFKNLREFMKKFNRHEGILVTKIDEKTIDFDEGSIKLIPVHKFLLEERYF